MRPRLPFAIAGLVLALGAIVAILYVLAEPVRGIEEIRDTEQALRPLEREMILHRYRESGVPLIIGSVAGVLAAAISLIARRSPLGAAAILAACIALAGAAYVWSRYGEQILAQM
jgi:hypothetical protein